MPDTPTVDLDEVADRLGWPPEIPVTVQAHQRPGRPVRWAYVLHEPDWWPFVSRYCYASEAAARRAGERERAALVRHTRTDLR